MMPGTQIPVEPPALMISRKPSTRADLLAYHPAKDR